MAARIQQRARFVGTSAPRERRGAVVVEMAFVTVVLSIFILGICEMNRSLNVDSCLSEAVRRGCVIGSRPGFGNTAIHAEVRQTLQSMGLPSDNATIAITVNDQPLDAGRAVTNDKITVSVTIPFADVSWVGSNYFMGSGSNLVRSISMLKQG